MKLKPRIFWLILGAGILCTPAQEANALTGALSGLKLIGAPAVYTVATAGITHMSGDGFTKENEEPGFGWTYLGGFSVALVTTITLYSAIRPKKGNEEDSVYLLGTLIGVAGSILAYSIARADIREDNAKAAGGTSQSYIRLFSMGSRF